MKPVIIIAIVVGCSAVGLGFLPIVSHAQQITDTATASDSVSLIINKSMADTSTAEDSGVVTRDTEIYILRNELKQASERSTIFGIAGMIIGITSFLVAWYLAKRNEGKLIQAMIDITNAGYRISKVTSGKVVQREDGTVGANLVQVVGGKKIVAEKQVSHTTDTFIAEPKKQSENNNEDNDDSKPD